MKCVVLAAVLALAAADSLPYRPPQPQYRPAPSYHPQEEHYHRPYAFDYAVSDHYTGAVFDQQEKSDRDSVYGSYSVNLPDGRIQHVKYTADHAGYGGYNAEVSYEGEAHHPEPYHRPAPKPYQPAPEPYRPAPEPYRPAPEPYRPAPEPYRPAYV